MWQIGSKRLCLCLLSIACLSSPTAVDAFSVADALDGLRLERLEVGVAETPRAIGGTDTDRPYVLVALSNSTFFVDQYGPDNKRLSRSIPLPIIPCIDAVNNHSNAALTMAIQEQPSGIVFSSSVCAAGNTVFFHDRDQNITSYVMQSPGETGRAMNISIWQQAKAATLEANLAKSFVERAPEPLQVLGDRILTFSTMGRPDPTALTTLVNQPRSQISNRNTHLSAIRDRIAGMDWRTALDTRTLNNTAFYLAESQDCRDVETALTMLKVVQSADPARSVALLNMADAYRQAEHLKCRNVRDSVANAQEAFRLYCSNLGLTRVPVSVRNRHRDAFTTSIVTGAKACHPQFAMQRAILAADNQALTRALADPENDVNITFPDGYRALGLALVRKQGAMARQLLDAGAHPDRSSFYEGDTRKYEYAPMVRAIWNYDVQTVAALAAKTPTNLIFTMRLSQHRPLLIVSALRPRTSTQEAQKIAMFDLILTLGPSPTEYDVDNRNAFYMAASSYSSKAFFDRVVTFGAFINQPSRTGQTALFAIGPFASGKPLETQTILLNLGANPNQQDQNGTTPLVHAFAWFNADTTTIEAMVNGLLDAGADPNLADKKGQTALFYAALRPMPDTVDLLIERGARLPPTRPYETDPIAFVRARISEIERDPMRERVCACLANYRAVLASLTKLAAPAP